VVTPVMYSLLPPKIEVTGPSPTGATPAH
jgi:hypothetical protein